MKCVSTSGIHLTGQRGNLRLGVPSLNGRYRRTFQQREVTWPDDGMIEDTGALF
jgi:hypothetical protein